MLQLEVKDFCQRILAKLWPDWDPDDEHVQLGLWQKVLGPHTWEDAKVAAENARMRARSREPRFPDIIDELQKITDARRASEPKKEKDWPPPTVFLQCRESGMNCKAGNFFEIQVLPLELMNNKDLLVKIAFSNVREMERCYGGKWIVVQQSTMWAMRKEQIELQYAEAHGG